MSDELRVVVRAAERPDPFRGDSMSLAALGPRHLRIGGVADQHVPECVLDLALDARSPLLANELALLELAQGAVDLGSRGRTHCRHRPQPKGRPDDGRVLEQPLVRGFQAVEPGGDDALDGLGHREIGIASMRVNSSA